MNQNPNVKRSASQLQKVRKWLEAGRKITPGQARKKWGCDRLGARIQQMKDAGIPVLSKLVKVNTQHGSARVAQYWIEDPAYLTKAKTTGDFEHKMIQKAVRKARMRRAQEEAA